MMTKWNIYNEKMNSTDYRIIQSLIKPFGVSHKPKCFTHNPQNVCKEPKLVWLSKRQCCQRMNSGHQVA